MRVGHQNGIQHGELVDGYPWWRNALQDTGERRIEVRIRQNPLPADLDEQGRMTDVGHPDPVGCTRARLRHRRDVAGR